MRDDHDQGDLKPRVSNHLGAINSGKEYLK